MKFSPTALDGAYVVEPERRSDVRGFFARTWCRDDSVLLIPVIAALFLKNQWRVRWEPAAIYLPDEKMEPSFRWKLNTSRCTQDTEPGRNGQGVALIAPLRIPRVPELDGTVIVSFFVAQACRSR